MNDTQKNHPIRTFQDQSLQSAVFENQTKTGSPLYSVRLDWTYRDGQAFKNSSLSLTERTLFAARGLLEESGQFVKEQRAALAQPAREEITAPVEANTQAREVFLLHNQSMLAAVHEHQGEHGAHFSVNIERHYEHDGKLKTSTITVPEKAILSAKNLLSEATEVVQDKRQEQRSAARQENGQGALSQLPQEQRQTQSR